MQTIKRIGIVTIIIIAMAGFMKWTSWHDEQTMIAADKYEKCVKDQYGVTPAYWYEMHGEYPTCE